MIEAYTRDELDRSIEAAFRAGFGNALAELDGDLQPFGHGRRRRCLCGVFCAGERDGQVSGRPLIPGLRRRLSRLWKPSRNTVHALQWEGADNDRRGV